MNKSFVFGALTALGLTVGTVATATSIPSVTDPYFGNYDLENAFGGHGLWLPGLFTTADRTWSVVTEESTANFTPGASGGAGYMDLIGRVENGVGGSTQSLDFNFRIFENPDHAGDLVCGTAACEAADATQRENIVFFDMGTNDIMGTVTGTAGTDLEGLSIDITMRTPASYDGEPKLGQLGFGGNWLDLSFGYSNWLNWTVTSQATDASFGTRSAGGTGDLNLNFVSNGSPITPPPPIPLPAGLPLLLVGLLSFGAIRRVKA